MYHTWNSTKGLERLARRSFETLAEAQAFRTPEGGPNRISSDECHEWMLGAYPDRAPQWFRVADRYDYSHPAHPFSDCRIDD